MSTDIPGGDSPRKTEFDLLAQEVDREVDADRAFFRNNPKRNCYVRRSFSNEMRLTELASGEPGPLPGWRSYTVVLHGRCFVRPLRNRVATRTAAVSLPRGSA
jgi:hypothetical protein